MRVPPGAEAAILHLGKHLQRAWSEPKKVPLLIFGFA